MELERMAGIHKYFHIFYAEDAGDNGASDAAESTNPNDSNDNEAEESTNFGDGDFGPEFSSVNNYGYDEEYWSDHATGDYSENPNTDAKGDMWENHPDDESWSEDNTNDVDDLKGREALAKSDTGLYIDSKGDLHSTSQGNNEIGSDVDEETLGNFQRAWNIENDKQTQAELVKQGLTKEEAAKEVKSHSMATSDLKKDTYNPDSIFSSAWNEVKETANKAKNGLLEAPGKALDKLNTSLGGKDSRGLTKENAKKYDEYQNAYKTINDRLMALDQKDKLTEKEQKERDALISQYGAEKDDRSNAYTLTGGAFGDKNLQPEFDHDKTSLGERAQNIAKNAAYNVETSAYNLSQSLGGGDRYGLTSTGKAADRDGDGKVSFGERAQNIGDNVVDSLIDWLNPYTAGDKLIDSGKDDWDRDAFGKLTGAGKMLLGGLANALYFSNPLNAGKYAAGKALELATNDNKAYSDQKSADPSSFENLHNDDSSNNDIVLSKALKSPKTVAKAAKKMEKVKANIYDDKASEWKKSNASKISAQHNSLKSDEDLKTFIMATYLNDDVAKKMADLIKLKII